MAARFYNCVLAALRFEMIFRFVEFYPGALLDVLQRFFREIDMAIQTSADSGAAKRNFAQSFDRFLRPHLRIRDLLRVPGEFLSQSHRRRIHQVRAANLDDVPEFFRLSFEGAVQFFQSRD